MDSRRLVVWLSAGILGFQGGTLVLDLIHCSVLSWISVRRYGLEQVVPMDPTEVFCSRPRHRVDVLSARG